MEKHLGIGSSLYGEFDISLLVTKQAALLVVYLTLQSQAREILERLGEPRGTGRSLVSTAHIPFQRVISTPSMHFTQGRPTNYCELGEPWTPAGLEVT